MEMMRDDDLFGGDYIGGTWSFGVISMKGGRWSGRVERNGSAEDGDGNKEGYNIASLS